MIKNDSEDAFFYLTDLSGHLNLYFYLPQFQERHILKIFLALLKKLALCPKELNRLQQNYLYKTFIMLLFYGKLVHLTYTSKKLQRKEYNTV